ncbi:MAG: four helix bundle protein [Patescibacteria group bacterium]|nr:four helix bundle protein [Patescibacteria group bacterium]
MERFGLYQKIENIIIDCLELGTLAALTARDKKSVVVAKLKIQIEVAKRLTRLMWELKIIADKKYLLLAEKMMQISKMASGWIKYLNK